MEVTGRKRKRKSPSSKLRKSNAFVFAEENGIDSDLEYPMQSKQVAVDIGTTNRCIALDEAMADGSGHIHGSSAEEGSVNNGNSNPRTVSSRPAHLPKAGSSQADQDWTATTASPVQLNPKDIKTEPEEDIQAGVLWGKPDDNDLHSCATEAGEFRRLSTPESSAVQWNDDGCRSQNLAPRSFTNSSADIASSPREKPEREPACDTHDLSMHRCKCSCEPLLHSILYELKSIRELMQSQTAVHADVGSAAVQTNAVPHPAGRALLGRHLGAIPGGLASRLASTLAPNSIPTPASSTQPFSSGMALTNGSPGTPLRAPHGRIASAVGHAPPPAAGDGPSTTAPPRRPAAGFQSGEPPRPPRPCGAASATGGEGPRHPLAIGKGGGGLGLNLSGHGQVQVLGVDAGAAVFTQARAGGLEQGGNRMAHAEHAPFGQAPRGGAPASASRLPDAQCQQASRFRIANPKAVSTGPGVAAQGGRMAAPAGRPLLPKAETCPQGAPAVQRAKHTFPNRATEQGAGKVVGSLERSGPNSSAPATSALMSAVGIQERTGLASESPGNAALDVGLNDVGHFTENCFYSLGHSPQGDSMDLAVQLADGYNVFMARSQLEEILVHYTRSGSLLFRKLVAAFFDDHTLANSLPNGKRKRGLNDPRKGLEPNIVAAIRSFTENYCENKKITKLPGPKDWVQLLQDQIKLARRRIRRAHPNHVRLPESVDACEEDKLKSE